MNDSVPPQAYRFELFQGSNELSIDTRSWACEYISLLRESCTSKIDSKGQCFGPLADTLNDSKSPQSCRFEPLQSSNGLSFASGNCACELIGLLRKSGVSKIRSKCECFCYFDFESERPKLTQISSLQADSKL